MSKTKQAAAWGDAHKREAKAFALERLSVLVREYGGEALDKLDEEIENAGFEDQWRPGSILSHALGLKAKGMRRALRRVRALAEGRLVRETEWRWLRVDGSIAASWEGSLRALAVSCAATWRAAGCRLVRVTRIIRMAP